MRRKAQGAIEYLLSVYDCHSFDYSGYSDKILEEYRNINR